MFKPYRGDDVKVGSGGYVLVDLPSVGEVWATIFPTDESWRRLVNDDPFRIEILGWGQAPTVWWHELSVEQQGMLRSTL
jgi:hypothetical protein